MAHKSGYVAIIGKPNAGKSTLLNALLGTKLSIVTHKAQTTRHQVMGILSDEESQIIFLDTPGIIKPRYSLQRAMMSFVDRARNDADLVLLIVDLDDANLPGVVFDMLKDIRKPVALVLNKTDLVSDDQLKSVRKRLEDQFPFFKTVAVSALQQQNLPDLKEMIRESLPEGPPFYPKDQLSEHPLRFFVAELIRERIFIQFHQEIPYSTTVNIVEYDESETIDRIYAEVVVNAESQKGILIGKGGKAIKRLGVEARKEIEELLDKQVYLDLHIKVRAKWRTKDHMVRSFGYEG